MGILKLNFFLTQKRFTLCKGFVMALSSLIFYNAVIPTNMMDYILGTIIVFSGGKRLCRQIDAGLHAGSYALIMKYHGYANV